MRPMPEYDSFLQDLQIITEIEGEKKKSTNAYSLPPEMHTPLLLPIPYAIATDQPGNCY